MNGAQPLTPEDGYEALYARHYRQILAYCGRRLPSDDTLDAVADTFLVAWRRRDEIPAGDAERAWLYGVAFRVVSNYRRSARRRRRLNERVERLRAPTPEEPDGQVLRREADRRVIAALGRLAPLDREVLLLRLWEELPSAQIAAALGISDAAVRKRTSRARRRLARQLDVRNSQSEVIPIRPERGGPA